MTRDQLNEELDRLGVQGHEEIDTRVVDYFGNSEGCTVTFARRGGTEMPAIRYHIIETKLTKRRAV